MEDASPPSVSSVVEFTLICTFHPGSAWRDKRGDRTQFSEYDIGVDFGNGDAG